jgi:hypothetical protein
VRTTHFLAVIALSAAGSIIGGCSPVHTTAATTTTAADVANEASMPAPAARESTPAIENASVSESEAAGSAEAAPPGQLVCRTKSIVDGTTELYLDWKGTSAKGTLRRSAPSGMVYVQRVEAERADSLIIVDEPENQDLMNHAAVVGKQDGKTLMRTNGTWTPCE